jgi:hypothetical protein
MTSPFIIRQALATERERRFAEIDNLVVRGGARRCGVARLGRRVHRVGAATGRQEPRGLRLGLQCRGRGFLPKDQLRTGDVRLVMNLPTIRA